jgi:ABC-2 type transport system ATP-binding protein
MSLANAIEVEHAQKTFGATKAVQNLDLAIPTGSLCGFLGPNGAGKTTTIRMMMSIIRPDSGSIRVLGGDALAYKDKIGYLPEERGVYRKMRVGEFLRFIARLKGMPAKGLDQTIRSWLERIDLAASFKQRCEELSKGMQQKVQFLASVIHDPELIILDEPFSGLDPVNAMLLNSIIQELNDEGRTILFSTHVLHQADRMCDRIVLIDQGTKILDDTLKSIRQRFDPHTVAIEPFGDPEACKAVVETVAGVDHATVDGEGIVHATIGTDGDQGEAMRLIVGVADARRIEHGRVTLDEVFVKLVGRSEAVLHE